MHGPGPVRREEESAVARGSSSRPKKVRKPKDPEGRMSLGEHLTELRNRLVITAIAVLIGAIIGWIVYPWVFEWLKQPFTLAKQQGMNAQLNFQGIGKPLNVQLQVSAYTGLILAAPIAIWQTWAFVMPGLHKNERRYAVGFFGTAIPLFFLGCAAGYFAINKAVPVFLSFTPGSDQVTNIISYDDYLGLLVKTMLAFGIAFVLPVVLVVLNFMGILSGRQMLKAWRWVVFVCFAFTAVMVPTPDPITLIGMSMAIASLFFAAVAISMYNDRRRAKKQAAQETTGDMYRASSLEELDQAAERSTGGHRTEDA